MIMTSSPDTLLCERDHEYEHEHVPEHEHFCKY